MMRSIHDRGGRAARFVRWGCALPVCLLLGLSAGRAEAETNSFVVPAWAFDRGNARTFTEGWADAGPMVAFGGKSPVFVEYDIEFPLTTQYAVSIQYACVEARPVALFFDGQRTGSACRIGTGSWNTSGAKWEETCRLPISKGKHTLKLQRPAAFPHVVSLRFTADEALPAGWTLNRPTARKLTDPLPQPGIEPWVPDVSVAALRRAIEDLRACFGAKYPSGENYLKRLSVLETQLASSDAAARAQAKADLVTLQRESLLANPLLDFDEILLVKRHVKAPDLGLPHNWQSNSSLPQRGYDDSICRLPLKGDGRLTPLYKPDRDVFVGDVDLDFDAGKMLFSMPGTNGRWQVFELRTDGSGLRQLTGEQPDVDSYDACYLPDGRILFTSTACFIGVPCVYGNSHVANLYRMEADGRNIRQLCFDQEHDWCPTVLNNGRVLYSRWEYADTPHSNTRLLFQMNPDGTEQMEFIGSGSYWPNSFFYARPIPGHPTKVVAVIGGHHDNPRMGELVIFDPERGRHEGSPAVQRIPGYGQTVEPIIRDGLTLRSWPKFLHPYPLSENYFLVSCKPEPDAPWGVYLVDVFDNLLPLKQLTDYALFEPVPLRKSAKPPVIPDKVNYGRTDAVVVIQDIYAGEGMKGVPRGTVKSLRLFTYHFAYQGMGGLLGVVGAEGPWDIRRVLGTVPVNEDGSAKFLVPANTPISIQPLDAEGKAIQHMRSWMTAMPGEVVQCVGCHERQNSTPQTASVLAMRQSPAEIKPWYGPARGFSYPREVQPVIDRHCVSCHNGQPRPDGQSICDLRGDVKISDWKSVTPGNGGAHAGKFSVGYFELSRHVRRNGIEGDYHVLEPMEFHADTTDLVQLLKQGHYGVELDAESWDRLITWIDMNCPYHGTWGEEIDHPGKQRERRRDLLKLYANVDDDPEAVIPAAATPMATVKNPAPASPAPPPSRNPASSVSVKGWPFDAAEAKRRQTSAGAETHKSVDLGNGVKIEFVLIPAGDFVTQPNPETTASPQQAQVRVEKAFWMAAREIENRTYALFDPTHDSRVEDKNTYQFGIHGIPANQPDQPVVRISWNEAMAFCEWLSAKTGERVTLPTESQWEWACRAGTDSPFNFGALDADFSSHANLADAKLSEFASDPYTVDVPLRNPTRYDDWIPKAPRYNDGALITVAPGRYHPNAWGLFDMHGNAAEWTRNNRADGSRVFARGGSWRDVPPRTTSDFRVAYQPWQRVYNVGFRVISEGPAGVAANDPQPGPSPAAN